jgi:hypothetical protein
MPIEAAAEAIGRVSIPGDNGEGRLNEPATRLRNECDSRTVPRAQRMLAATGQVTTCSYSCHDCFDVIALPRGKNSSLMLTTLG